MNEGDEQLLRGRVYGAEHDDPDPGPKPGRTYAELVGGPLDGLLDGLLVDIHEWRTVEVDDGVALITELVRWPGGRALYAPRPGEARKPGPGVACRFSTPATPPERPYRTTLPGC